MEVEEVPEAIPEAIPEETPVEVVPVVPGQTGTLETFDISVSDAEIIASELVLIRYALYFLIIVILATRFVRGRN